MDEFIQDAKFNRGGHAIYELSRVLKPFRLDDKQIGEAVEALKDLSGAIYSVDVDSASFARAKALASSAVQRLPLEKVKALLSADDMMVVKSSSSLLNAAKPLSVDSAAVPSSSEIKNGISKDTLADSGADVNNFSGSVMMESQRREAVKNELARVAVMDKQVAGLADDWERVLGADGRLMLDFLAPLC